MEFAEQLILVERMCVKFAEQLILVEIICVKFQSNRFRGTHRKIEVGIPPTAGVEGSEKGPGEEGLMNLYRYK